MSIPQNPLIGITGTEFLLSASNFIGPFNPNQTGITGLAQTGNYDIRIEDTLTVPCEIFLFPKEYFIEPTKEEFLKYSKLTDLKSDLPSGKSSFLNIGPGSNAELLSNQSKKVYAKIIQECTFSLEPILSDLSGDSDPIRRIKITPELIQGSGGSGGSDDLRGPTFNIETIGYEPVALKTLDYSIFDDSFIVLRVSNLSGKTIRTYVDLPYAEQLIFISSDVLQLKKDTISNPQLPEYREIKIESKTYPPGTKELNLNYTEPFQLDKPQTEGVKFSTKDINGNDAKAYIFGGWNLTNVTGNPSSYPIDDSMYVSDINLDGSLVGFTKIGVHPIDKCFTASVIVINTSGIRSVYIFGGYISGVNTSVIRRAHILDTGEITEFTNIDNLPEAQRNLQSIRYNEEKGIIYVCSGYSTTYLQLIYTYKINPDLSLSLVSTYTPTINNTDIFAINSGSISPILNNPVTGKKEMYLFGGMHPTTSYQHKKILRLTLNSDTGYIEGQAYIGDITSSVTGSQIASMRFGGVFIDTNNLFFMSGSLINYAYYSNYSNRIYEIRLDALYSASTTQKIQLGISNKTLPFPTLIVNCETIETKYGYYVISPLQCVNATTTIYPYSSTARVLSFKKEELLSSLNLENIELKTDPSSEIRNLKSFEFGLGALYKRYYEEYLTNLFVKQNQALEAYGESIKFIKFIKQGNTIIPANPIVPINVIEFTRPSALPRNADIFLKYIEQLCIETNLDRYNDYAYFSGSVNTNRDYDLIIPEIIFNILGTKDLYELNVEIFLNEENGYLVSNPPAAEIDPDGILTSEFIELVLYCFYKCKIGKKDPSTGISSFTSNKDSLGFGPNGLILPSIKGIEYSVKDVNYGFIFFPQRHDKNRYQRVLNGAISTAHNSILNKPKTMLRLPFVPSSTNYLEKTKNVSSCVILPAIPEENINMFPEAQYLEEFDYFLAPNGLDTNPGTFNLPKKTVEACPNYSKILMLPGTYSHMVLNNIASQIVSGVGESTIISSDFGNYSGIFLRSRGGRPETNGTVKNLKINIITADKVLLFLATYYYNPTTFTFLNVVFNFNNKNCAKFGSLSDNYGTLNLINCTFENVHSYVTPGSFGANNRTAIESTITNTPLDNILINDPESILVSDKTLINNIKQSYTFKPMYTLMRIDSVDSIESENSNTIILDTVNNITDIRNLDIRL